ncbi:unnamed protein product [Mytilus coruscus]|uniref:Uncharacterized protein n=1 Tax=Mytilus coruscus TaxID=42192 RepID=A0A6J8CUJ7_MYTCO|nr:unnamed protein product [Mytilus coruscus]
MSAGFHPFYYVMINTNENLNDLAHCQEHGHKGLCKQCSIKMSFCKSDNSQVKLNTCIEEDIDLDSQLTFLSTTTELSQQSASDWETDSASDRNNFNQPNKQQKLSNFKTSKMRMLTYVNEIMHCENSNCDEDDHERHHQFISSPEMIVSRERRRLAFGCGVISQKVCILV